MEQVTPVQLHPHRVYLTTFDRVTYSQVAWTTEDVEQIKNSLTRTIKLLSLTKGHVVVAASHLLESELARELILPYPDLISKRIVIPALRDDFASCNAFLEAKRDSSSPGEASLYNGEEQIRIASLIDSEGLVVRWNPISTSGWFKNRLLHDLRDDKSLVCNILSKNSLNVSDEFYAELEDTQSLSRGIIYQATKKHGNLKFREIVNSYVDFLYYLSGAKAVQSEGILPQENIMDFNLSDFTSDNCSLSEHEIFTKMFIDSVKAATSTHFPEDLLDALEIADIMKLHDIAIDQSFVDKYNAIQERTKESLQIEDPERLVLLMNELLDLEAGLYKAYSNAVREELPSKLRQLQVNRTASLMHALTSLILFPYGTLVGIKDILVSTLRLLHRDALASDIQDRIDNRLAVLKRRAGSVLGGEKCTLLNFVDELKSQYIKQLQG